MAPPPRLPMAQPRENVATRIAVLRLVKPSSCRYSVGEPQRHPWHRPHNPLHTWVGAQICTQCIS